ncbi:hypothetical protein GTQ99_01255 [Kineococcus sp. T13]|uniref:hypothetical protein n=1 Tax=Kineococcus vitellinus TaxID=2696565 RepID=UPI0014121D40|nr:hypothetical protein [Kineococcus vitellinus]NAZ74059.1 hypothetical protein [Kineococcus vitellinus]
MITSPISDVRTALDELQADVEAWASGGRLDAATAEELRRHVRSVRERFEVVADRWPSEGADDAG